MSKGKKKTSVTSFHAYYSRVTNFDILVTEHAKYAHKQKDRGTRPPPLLGDHTVVAGEHHVLVAASQPGALVPERLAETPLHPVRHLGAGPATGAGPLPRHGAQEVHPVRGLRVGEEHHGVQPLVAARRRAVQRRHLRVQRHGLHVVGQLREQRAEPQQVRLAAGGALGADREVAVLQQPRHRLGVALAVARQPHRLDGRDDLGQPAEAVRHGRHGLLERGGEHDRVDQRPVRAHVQDAPALDAGLRGAEARRAVADAEEGAGPEADLVGEQDADGDADDGEDDAEGEEEEESERGGGGREEGEAAVVEDERLRVPVPRQPRGLGALPVHDVNFLQKSIQLW